MNIEGYKICPEWLKNTYRRSVNYACQMCNKTEKEVGKLTAHRIIRGHVGGKYTIQKLNKKGSNVKVVCNECHKKLHYNEFNRNI